jgi:hypothetical protein
MIKLITCFKNMTSMWGLNVLIAIVRITELAFNNVDNVIEEK